MDIVIKTNIKSQDIADLVVTAFEGGSNYWLNSAFLRMPNEDTLKEKPWYSDPALYDGDFAIECEFDDAGSKGKPFTKKIITQDDFRKGFEIFATKQPRHYADFISEDYDATTADVFIQCVIFGEVIFG